MDSQRKLPEQPSPQFLKAWQLINGTKYQDEVAYETESFPLLGNIQTTYEQNFESYRRELKERIRKQKKLIADKDSEISNLNREMGFESICCMLGCLMEVGGATSIGSGIADIESGQTLSGLVEITGGVASMHVGDKQVVQSTHTIKTLSQKKSQLDTERSNLKADLTGYHKDLYRLEKKITLQVLNEKLTPESILHKAVIHQFEAINTDIQRGEFSKTYVDVAVNTRKILEATNESERNEYADKHLALVAKKSVSKIVGGCMLMFLGVAVALTSVILGTLLLSAGPIAIFGGLAGLGTGIGLGVKGNQMLKSGLPRDKTPLLTQSLFKVVQATKEEPILKSSYQLRNLKM